MRLHLVTTLADCALSKAVCVNPYKRSRTCDTTTTNMYEQYILRLLLLAC